MPTNLLIVDDNEEHLDLMFEILKEENRYALFRAVSGEEALEVVADKDIQIVILDVVMPGMDGYEVCRQIRKQYRLKPIQIVMISGFNHKNDLDELLELGADDFISKPITALELQARLKAALIRLRDQTKVMGVLRERTQPEGKNFSTLVAENIQLRQEYQKVRRINEELQANCHQLEQLASLDTLSGLLNRRTLFKRIEIEIERTTRLDWPLTGIMIDIDHFKRVNDNFGHQCGDIVIQEIGAKLTKSLRKYDYAGRYGGEEFFVVFSNTMAGTAQSIAERFRLEMQETRFNCGDEQFNVTVSIGVSQYIPGESPGRWISRADGAMYQAKQRGRNQVVIS
ncbi:MAG: diguanylate cyclase [Spirochaetaceae bacterium]|nr:MAG: diguanylate cyclase [Spirochaetaceae bacterium]